MRLYLPADLSELALPTLAARPASAVTSALRAALPDEDEEGLERSAFLTAADLAVLHLAGREVPSRRVVLALDVPDSTRFTQASQELADLPSVVGQFQGLGEAFWPAVVSIHLDEPEAAADVAAAFDDDDAFDALGEVDLLWYHPSERSALIAQGL